mmetsp:Transcript_48516/g.96681  ORF Transcript_48516/g.96681 Transcript_48516/m.96681 type:complete len:115 (-) Transcript_48516:286-630(-)|eukprot:CAMPEP_0174712328 /NCGR_PEP_ID=MMETSP1094-20130205/13367_1 /TAXON_ID=156173 /ORGANISM="Chrysochromulina brevifilum, Strain UTEX LB 985" /LENGTH=114 /DNA_ID=CAMNT_0015911391 /DNA_START=102 /DNA_END=446 /DNA_ORIENTATION=-
MPEQTYDSSIIKSEPGKPLTMDVMEAHEKALKTEVPAANLIAVLKTLVPSKVEQLDSKLAKYQAGKLNAPALLSLAKMDVGNDALIDAFTTLVPGYEKRNVNKMAPGWPHPIVA